MSRSPLPWSMWMDGLHDANDRYIATLEDFGEPANLEFLLCAVNAHDALVQRLAAAEAVFEMIEAHPAGIDSGGDAYALLLQYRRVYKDSP